VRRPERALSTGSVPPMALRAARAPPSGVDAVGVVEARGGACSRSDVLHVGVSRRSVDAAVRRGELHRAGRSGLAVPGAPTALVAAAGSRSALACVSALAAEQLPLLVSPAVAHLASSRHRSAPGRVWHRIARPAGLAVPLVAALAQAARCRPAAEVLAAVDAAFRSGRVDRDDLAGQLRTHESGHLRWALRHADPRSESVLESALRAVLIGGGVSGVEPQAVLEGVGRVDLLVDGWLVLEADGHAFHSDRSDYRTDRRRGVAATVAGYVTLRFSFEDVVADPAGVLRAVRATLARRYGRGFRTAC